jgi:hypothetical protein
MAKGATTDAGVVLMVYQMESSRRKPQQRGRNGWETRHKQGSSGPFAFLGAPGASSGQTSVHAVAEPWLPL